MCVLQTEINKLTDRQKSDAPPVVLVADDHDDSRSMLRCLLEMWEYQVVEARDGSEAAALAEQFCPDLILMDVRMPLLDGFDAARKIRGSAKIGATPIVFLSGCDDAIYRDAGDELAGEYEYLVKPLDFEKLKSVTGKYLPARRDQ